MADPRSSDRRSGGAGRVTIKDVASFARVSTATVSNALNGKGRVDPATRERVEAAAQTLGYRPSRTARALRSKRTGAIAFLVPAFERAPTQRQMLSLDIYMRLAGSAAMAAFAGDHALMLIPPLRSAADLDDLGVDGGIICDPAVGDDQVSHFEELGKPVVTIERRVDEPPEPRYVCADNAACARELCDHVVTSGAERSP